MKIDPNRLQRECNDLSYAQTEFARVVKIERDRNPSIKYCGVLSLDIPNCDCWIRATSTIGNALYLEMHDCSLLRGMDCAGYHHVVINPPSLHNDEERESYEHCGQAAAGVVTGTTITGKAADDPRYYSLIILRQPIVKAAEELSMTLGSIYQLLHEAGHAHHLSHSCNGNLEAEVKTDLCMLEYEADRYAGQRMIIYKTHIALVNMINSLELRVRDKRCDPVHRACGRETLEF